MHIRFYFVASFLSIITHVSFFSFTNLSFSFSQLSGFLEQAYQSSGPAPSLHSLETVWDWKSWLGNHMHGLTGHSAPHVFHFFCDAAGRPVICDKAYHTQGTYSDPYQLLTSIPTGLFIISPPFISPATPLTSPLPGAPFTIPPQAFPPEVLSELADNCHAPLFLESELCEWADIFEAHEALVSSTQPTCDTLIFDGLTAHPITNPLLDGPLFCLQTRVKVVHTRTTPQVQCFNFAPGLWVAVCTAAVEDLRKRLNVHWWNFANGRWADHGSEGTVPMGSVLACGFHFDPSTGVPPATVQEIFNHL